MKTSTTTLEPVQVSSGQFSSIDGSYGGSHRQLWEHLGSNTQRMPRCRPT